MHNEVGKFFHDVFDSKRISKYMRMKSEIKFTTRFIYCCGFQFQVLCQKFLTPQTPKTVQLSMGKIQPNVELTF